MPARSSTTTSPNTHEALDPRVAYLMVDLLEEVMRSGTAAGVRGRGFTLPAAGKTGTSRDGWFAGFTSRIICIVWVGFDDNRELNLEGARSALPIWTEFMKRAHKHREYRNVKEFEPPDGIVMVQVDPATGALAAPGCPGAQMQAFIAGTATRGDLPHARRDSGRDYPGDLLGYACRGTKKMASAPGEPARARRITPRESHARPEACGDDPGAGPAAGAKERAVPANSGCVQIGSRRTVMRLSLRYLPGFVAASLAAVCFCVSLSGAPQAPLASTSEEAQPAAPPPAALTPAAARRPVHGPQDVPRGHRHVPQGDDWIPGLYPA